MRRINLIRIAILVVLSLCGGRAPAGGQGTYEAQVKKIVSELGRFFTNLTNDPQLRADPVAAQSLAQLSSIWPEMSAELINAKDEEEVRTGVQTLSQMVDLLSMSGSLSPEQNGQFKALTRQLEEIGRRALAERSPAAAAGSAAAPPPMQTPSGNDKATVNPSALAYQVAKGLWPGIQISQSQMDPAAAQYVFAVYSCAVLGQRGMSALQPLLSAHPTSWTDLAETLMESVKGLLGRPEPFGLAVRNAVQTHRRNFEFAVQTGGTDVLSFRACR